MLVFLKLHYHRSNRIQSLAGHYIPQLADAILSYNSHSSGFKFNVKGIAVSKKKLLLLLLDFPFNSFVSLSLSLSSLIPFRVCLPDRESTSED